MYDISVMTCCHDIAEIVLNVALNTIAHTFFNDKRVL